MWLTLNVEEGHHSLVFFFTNCIQVGSQGKEKKTGFAVVD